MPIYDAGFGTEASTGSATGGLGHYKREAVGDERDNRYIISQSGQM